MLLGEVDGERQLPIIIGPAEARATALYLKGVKTLRPLTHDLFYNKPHHTGSQSDTCVNLQKQRMVFFTPIFTLRKTKRLYVLTHGLQTQLPWQCVPTVNSYL